MAKSRDAFRTISEVSEALDTPTHVLRFWESKFSQIKPVKRAGGRRYYRPEDIDLLAGIRTLLHDHGLTIKGAQKLLREQGVKHVASLGGDNGVVTEKAAPIAVATADITETPAPANATGSPVPANVPAPKAAPAMPPIATHKTQERTTILAEVAAPNQMMIEVNAAKIATLLDKLQTFRDTMRVA